MSINTDTKEVCKQVAKTSVRNMIKEVMLKAEITTIAFRLADNDKKTFNYVLGFNKSLTKVTSIDISYDGQLVNAVDTLADLLTEYFNIDTTEKMTIFTVVTINDDGSFTFG